MNILTQLFEIILLKRQPQDIDYDVSFAMLFVVAVTGLMYLAYSMNGVYTEPLAYSVTQNLSQAVFLYSTFIIAKKQNRFIQTCTALFGLSTIVLIVNLISVAIPPIVVIALILQVWTIYLSIKILKIAFNTNIFSALLLAISISIFSILVVSALYPEFFEETKAIMEVQLEKENTAS